MFSDVIEGLKNSELPVNQVELKKRFNIALVKKMAVLKLPYHFWSADPKINPAMEQLVWVALLLGDAESVVQVETVIGQEFLGRQIVGKSNLDSGSVVQESMKQMAEKFLRLAPDNLFRLVLADKVSYAFNAGGLKG